VPQAAPRPTGIGTTTINGINDAGDLVGSFVGDVNGTLATEGMLAVPGNDGGLVTSH
jgi:hypothetical protein